MYINQLNFRVIEFDNCWSIEKVVYNEKDEVVSHTNNKNICVTAKPKDGSRNYYGNIKSLSQKLNMAAMNEPIKEITLKEKKSDGAKKGSKVSTSSKGSSSKS
jgi:hypothetical protein